MLGFHRLNGFGLGCMILLVLMLCQCSNQNPSTSLEPTPAEQESDNSGVANIPPRDTPKEPPLVSEGLQEPVVQSAVNYITTDQLLERVSLRHNKPLFLNFWATWCAPCIAEMPHIAELYDQYGKQVDFVAVSCDEFTGSTDKVPQMIQDLNMTFHVHVLQADDQEKAISAIDPNWQGALPATFLYNPQGEKVQSFLGGQAKETFASAIEKLIEP